MPTTRVHAQRYSALPTLPDYCVWVCVAWAGVMSQNQLQAPQAGSIDAMSEPDAAVTWTWCHLAIRPLESERRGREAQSPWAADDTS